MDSGEIEARVEKTLRAHGGTPYRLRHEETWLVLWPVTGAPDRQGWKLHVSARAGEFADLVDVLLPVLLDEGCLFKLARSVPVLRRLNSGAASPESIGKAFTVYPRPDRFRDLARSLADLLRGRDAPRVLSDRRVDPDAPVYYRYGPFTRSWRSDPTGRLLTLIHGPDGEDFGALATMRYRQPTWVTDPFTGETGSGDVPRAAAAPAVLGGVYRVTGGVVESGRGDVYRAVDQRDGSPVIVKQARAYVDEQDRSGDVRMRLRNERRVLQALAGMPGVPRFLDHFRHGADEYLATTDLGPDNLEQDVLRHGRYLPDDGAGAGGDDRTLDRLACDLTRLVLRLHSRGVLFRDLSARNVVIAGGEVGLVDFGMASFDGLYIPGGTPGYAPRRQRRHQPPRPADDLFALGMVLLFAATGLHPVTIRDDLDVPRVRAEQALRSRYGAVLPGVLADVADLLSEDETSARSAAARLAESPRPSRARPSGARPPRALASRALASRALAEPPRLTPELAERIADHLLGDLLAEAGRVLSAPSSSETAHDACVYSGSAGIGLELLEHLDRPGVADCLDALVPFTAEALAEVGLPPGLLTGSTGVEIFLHRAAARGFATGHRRTLPDPDWSPAHDDLVTGTAGVGIGHLLRYSETLDPAHLAVAQRCARSLLDRPVPWSRTEQDVLPPSAAVEPSAGRAHGLAGVTEFLLVLGAHTADPELLAAGAERARALAARASALSERSRGPSAAPLAASWCQGLAGIGQSLGVAATVLGDPALAAAARTSAEACLRFLPRVSVPTQCCGAAGIGNTMIDLALTGDGPPDGSGPDYWDGARRAGVALLLRCGGTDEHPIPVEDDRVGGGGSWAFGVAGALSFFRRFVRRSGTAGLAVPLPAAPR